MDSIAATALVVIAICMVAQFFVKKVVNLSPEDRSLLSTPRRRKAKEVA